jgi:hypothetical protein
MYNLFPYHIGTYVLVRMSVPIGPNEWQNGTFDAKVEYVITEGSEVHVGFLLRTEYGPIIKRINLSDIYEILW